MINGQLIFQARFSYSILIKKCWNIRQTKEYLLIGLIQIRKWSERWDPDNISCFSLQEECAWELAAYVFKDNCSVVSNENDKYQYLTPAHSPNVNAVFGTIPCWNRISSFVATAHHRGVYGSNLV